jgi:hypothetical protein
MFPIKPFLSTCLAVAALALAAPGHAAVMSATCSVNINYSLNGTLVEAYTRQFTVAEGATYNDDFSTPTRMKTFSATLQRDGARSVLSIDYFNDVGTFNAISVDTLVKMLRPGTIESTSGRQGYYASSGVVGTHITDYSLSCRGS